MTSDESGERADNGILRLVDDEIYRALSPHLTRATLTRGTTLIATGDAVGDVYFPTTAILSLLAATKAGDTVEVGIVGCEGPALISGLLGYSRAPYRLVVQIGGDVYRAPAAVIRHVLTQQTAATALLMQYAHATMMMAAQSAVCNRFHTSTQRLTRLLLTILDRTPAETLPFTHEELSQMLGLQRSVVTGVAARLQDQRVIAYERGRISIGDRAGLSGASCECYQVIRRYFDSFLAGCRHDQ